MMLFESLQAVFETEQSFVALAADTTLRATIVLGLAVLFAVFGKRRSASTRHLVLSLALVGIVIIPFVRIFLPTWEIAMIPTALSARSAPAGIERPDRVNASPEFKPAVSGAATSTTINSEVNPIEAAPSSIEPTVPDSSPVSWLLLWQAGVVLSLIPVLVGLTCISLWRRTLPPVRDEDALRVLRECQVRIGVLRRVHMLETPASTLPKTSGTFWPTIYLPSNWRVWSQRRLEYVLLHELAHIRRLDVAMLIACRVACSLFWFHPLAWYALHRLKVERETATDDRVIAAGKQASDYASQLLDIVRTSVLQRSLVGAVSMAQTTQLEQRITRLLNSRISHKPISSRVQASLCALALITVVGAGVIRPSHVSAAPQTKIVAADAEPTVISYRGRVIDEQGRPIEDAQVMVQTSWSQSQNSMSLKATTDADGKFAFDSARSEYPNTSEGNLLWKYGSLLALAPNKAPAYYAPEAPRFRDDGQSPPENLDRQVDLKLSPLGEPIRGRIVDLEGKGVPDVAIQVIDVRAPKERRLSDFVAAMANAREARELERQYLPVSIPRGMLAALPVADIRTDKNGTFSFPTLGAERMVALRIDGPTIESQVINVLPLAMEQKTLPDYIGLGKTLYYGNGFTHAAAPSVPIVGVVKDKDTGKPIGGVNIRVGPNGLGGSSYVEYINATSDKRGRFELTGVSRGKEVRLIAMPSGDAPYLDAEARVDANVRNIDIELKKGVWFTGKVRDENSGKPVGHAAVFYFASSANPNASSTADGLARGWIDQHYMVKPDGSFRRAGLPGEGMLAVRVTYQAGDQYPMATGAAEVSWARKQGNSYMFYTNGQILNAGNYHRFVEVNPTEGQLSLQQDLLLSKGASVEGRIVDPDGNPVTGARAAGLSDFGSWDHTPLKQSTFKVHSYSPTKPRRLMFLQEERELAGTYWLEGEHKGELQVKLQPWAKVSARAVDASGEPIRDCQVTSAPHLRGGNSMKLTKDRPLRLPPQEAWTDSNGRFEIDRLVPGETYRLAIIEPEERRLLGKIDVELRLKPGEAKDLGTQQLKPLFE